MYINNKILIGKNDEYSAYILPKMANRHGIISGASGSGKTITLKVMAESFSNVGIPVFLVDVKGDLAGMCMEGVSNQNITDRVNKLNIENFNFQKFPTNFWDVYAKNGLPLRTTVSKMGAKLLSRMLNLTNAQEGVLTIVFKIAEDEELEIIDLKDLKSMLTYVGNKRQEYTLNYGNITLQSIGAIQRNLLSLEEEGGNYFFGRPDLSIKDFIHFDPNDGKGFINILHAVELFRKPTLYSTLLIWLLNELYSLPEVGDLDKPKLVFFIDEAHLLFSDMPEHLVKQIIQIVKLIRSKGVGLYFISQSPSDIPDEILSQLGNRVQHVLRYYTKNDEKAIKAAADSFRENPNFDTKEAISTLATGEALVSTQDEFGQPTIVEKVTILPPQSKMGTIDNITRKNIISQSRFYEKYINNLDETSAFEKIKDINETKDKEEVKKQEKKETKSKTKTKKSKAEKAFDKLTNKTINTLGKKIGDSIFKSLFK